MNDRLGDLGESVPSWAVDGGGDVETGFTENVPSPTNVLSSSAPPLSAWASDSDDFDFTPTSTEDDVKEVEQQSYMDRFFKDVDGIKDTIADIENATRRIGEINEETMLSTSEAKEKELSMEVRPLIDTTNKKAKKTKTLLTVLKEENKKLESEQTLKSSDMRVRENLGNTLTRKFIDEMKLYQSAQQKFKTDIKKKAERQILNMKSDATPEEVEEIMKSEAGREGLFQQQILAGGVNDSIKQAYTKVSTKYQDVLLLEQSVAELHQMFLDFALLTEQQGELIDQIEYNVKSAADYVEDANVNVYHAIEYSKTIRKKQCCIIMLVVIITLIILFSLGILP
jgi:t-SNARE complex subunit (syntaxin)|eukprot:scaffold6819_cov256-Chaetoceros_neogracile.AAC.7